MNVFGDRPLRDGAAQPRRHRRRVAVERIAQLGHHRHVIAELLDRLQDRVELEVLADRLRRPEPGPLAERHEDRAEPARRVGRRGGLADCRQRRHHRFEQRQGQRDPHPAQERPPGQRHLGDEHGGELLLWHARKGVAYYVDRYRAAVRTAGFSISWVTLVRFWNGVLLTIPSTIDENLYPLGAVSRTMARTVGMS